MILISIQEKVDEFINRNRRRKGKKELNLPSTGNIPIPNGYTKNMFKELSEVGFNIKPINLQNNKFQELGLSRSGILLEKLIETLNQTFDNKTIIEQESMKRMQNPLLYGKMKWIILLVILFMMINLFIALV